MSLLVLAVQAHQTEFRQVFIMAQMNIPQTEALGEQMAQHYKVV